MVSKVVEVNRIYDYDKYEWIWSVVCEYSLLKSFATRNGWTVTNTRVSELNKHSSLPRLGCLKFNSLLVEKRGTTQQVFVINFENQFKSMMRTN